MNQEIKIIRSKRRTMSLEIKSDLSIIVRCPVFTKQKDIELFVDKHSSWIEKHQNRIKKRNEYEHTDSLTSEQISAIKAKAIEHLSQRVDYYSELMSLKPQSVKVTSAQKRFGSCSSKNSICFSYKLMFYPDKAIDYVVVHELCHIKHKNHSKEFYALVEQYLPDYKSRADMLKLNLS